MKHGFWDKYSDGTSRLHRLDSRVKVGVAVAALVALNCWRAPPVPVYAAVVAALVGGVVVSRLPGRYVGSRGLIALPLALAAGVFLPFHDGDRLLVVRVFAREVAVSRPGTLLYLHLLAKTYLSLTVVTLVMATTPFRELTRALAWFRVPAFFLTLLSFTYRFAFLFIDTAGRVNLARRARSYGRTAPLWLTLGPAVAALFIRAYERAERVWLAMLARGYNIGQKE